MVKRRDFIKGSSVIAIGSSAGCVELESIFSDSTDTPDEDSETKEYREQLFLGEAEQISERVFDPNINYEFRENSYIYQDEALGFEEFGTKVSADLLQSKIVNQLESQEILPDNNIFVSVQDFDLTEVSNSEIRSQFQSERYGNIGVIVEYRVKVSEEEEIQETPETPIDELISYIPHSGNFVIQFDRRTYEGVIPVGVRIKHV